MTDRPQSTELTVDFNADLGEGFPWDDAILALVSSANIACGAHAGDETSIRRTLASAGARGVVVGAHPGYADRPNFGRVPQTVEADEVVRLVVEQVARLKSWATAEGAVVQYLKPHGALYNQAQVSEPHASGVVETAKSLGLPLLGMPGSLLESIARDRGVPFVTEGFPDRGYDSEGRLRPRSEPGAMFHEEGELARQVAWLLKWPVQSLCIHGDDEGAVKRSRWVRDAVERLGWHVAPFVPGA